MSVSKTNRTSSDLTTEQLAALRQVLPEAFSEDKIDWDKLRKVLGDNVDAGVERFGLTWPGKTAAIRNVLTPSTLTLRPEKDESVQFDETENLFIEGDNLEVLKLLQKTYHGAVKMIYIDPPYNTGGDFVYHDDFAAPLDNYLKQTGQKDGNGNGFSTNRETNGRYHSDWLSMMYPRLKLAWNMLKDEGVIFVSIDDGEAATLRLIMDEIFGEENLLAQLIHQRAKGGGQAKQVVKGHDYILAYAKDASSGIVLRRAKVVQQDVVIKDGKEYLRNDDVVRKTFGKYDKSLGDRRCFYEELEQYKSAKKKKEIDERIRKGELVLEKQNGKHVIVEYVLLDDASSKLYSIIKVLSEEGKNDLEELDIEGFDYPKPVELITQLIQSATLKSKSENDIILDFFAGSGTAAHAVMAQNVEDGGNRKWICVQLPEPTAPDSEARKAGYKTIADIAKERIRRAAKKVAAEDKKKQPLDYGFKVFKLDRSTYVENNFEYDPAKSEQENSHAFSSYLAKARQQGLFKGARDIDVVYENIVKEGFSLNSHMSEEKIGESAVHRVTDGEHELFICLEPKISEKTVRALTDAAYKGKTFICLDTALDDTRKANLGLNLELKTI